MLILFVVLYAIPQTKTNIFEIPIEFFKFFFLNCPIVALKVFLNLYFFHLFIFLLGYGKANKRGNDFGSLCMYVFIDCFITSIAKILVELTNRPK